MSDSKINATSITEHLLRFRKMLGQFNVLSISSVGGGGLVFAYLLKIGFFPDFTLANLAATFIAASLTAAVIVIAVAAFCLMPGLTTRYLLSIMPSVLDGPPDAHVYPRAPWHPSHSAMEHPQFVASLTPVAVVSWAWVFAEFLRRAYGGNWEAALSVYWVVIGAAVGAILCFGHPKRKKTMVVCWSVFAGALMTLAVLLAFSAYLPPAAAETSTGTVTPSSPATAAISTWAVTVTATVAKWGMAVAEALTGCWAVVKQASSHHPLSVASIAGAAVTALLIVSGIRAKPPKQPPEIALSPYRFRWLRYDCVKLTVAGAFVFLSLAILYLSVVWATQGTPDKWWYLLVAGAALLAMANWATFLATTVKHAAAVLGGTALLLFIFVPSWGGFPLFLPELTVRSLGLGSLLLSDVTIASKHCPVLQAYGAKCDSGTSMIRLTNVNLLSRIGSSMVLELSVAMTDDPSDLPKGGNGTLFVVDASSSKPSKHGCDENLAARLNDSELRKSGYPKGIRCVRLVLPRDDVLAYAFDGARTYARGPSALSTQM